MAKPTASSTGAKHQPEYEFGGPIVVTFVTLTLPLVVYALHLLCNETGCLGFSLAQGGLVLPPIPELSSITWWSNDAFLVFIGWFALHVVLLYVLPGQIAYGVSTDGHAALPYKINGFSAMCVSVALVALGHYLELFQVDYIYYNMIPLISSAIAFSYLLSIYLYLSSFGKGKRLAAGGNTGNPLYDFFIGRELNPRIGSFDLKEFCELRPGLVGWAVINFSMAYHQYATYGIVSASMVLVLIFQTIYVVDGLYNEKAILTTMDITTDGFGLMLAFGDLAWVPFTYTLQAHYLASREPVALSWAAIFGILALQTIGFSIFRGANSQKDAFRQNPDGEDVKHLKYLKTERGTRLIVSGWWGLVRHPNYLGDWIMAWAWCLPCGFDGLVPYFYVVYFAILLVHREFRDEHQCKLKYGKDWDKYCSIVRYRIIPFIF